MSSNIITFSDFTTPSEYVWKGSHLEWSQSCNQPEDIGSRYASLGVIHPLFSFS